MCLFITFRNAQENKIQKSYFLIKQTYMLFYSIHKYDCTSLYYVPDFELILPSIVIQRKDNAI